MERSKHRLLPAGGQCLEAFAFGGLGKSLIEADERHGSGIGLGGEEGRGKLGAVGGTKWMPSEELNRQAPDWEEVGNFIPGIGQLCETSEGISALHGCNRAFARAPLDSRRKLEPGERPRHD